MKKVFLVLAGSIAIAGTQAQTNSRLSVVRNTDQGRSVLSKTTNLSPAMLIKPAAHGNFAAKGTGAAFITENFSTGTATSLPTGWTTTVTPGNVKWHWTNKAASGPFNIGVLNSTTAANGWMIFDSDSAGVPVTANLISPTYNCTGHANIDLTFQQSFRRFRDTCYVDVSNNGGTTWTPFAVNPNNSLVVNAVTGNPAMARINISSVAGNQAAVKLRFRYVTASPDGSYNWLIDDIALSDMDPVDIALNKSGMLMISPEPTYNSLSAYSSIPVSLADSVFPFAFLNNFGTTAATNLPVNAKIFKAGTQVYNQSATYTRLPVGGYDSLVEWPSAPGYLPATTGSYTSVFSINPTGDASPVDNIDSFSFAVTDTVYAVNANFGLRSYTLLHQPSTDPNGERSAFAGTRFDIPVGKSDTVTSISASFSSNTTPGVTVIGQIYKLDMSLPGWSIVTITSRKTLAASDISTTAGSVYTNFRIDPTAGINTQILGEGVYAVVFTTINAPATSTVGLNTFTAAYKEIGLTGYMGQGSEAGNDGSVDFAAGAQIATGSEDPAMITMNFGHMPGNVSVNTIPGVEVGNAYPNPANTSVMVPVTSLQAAAVTVSLSNAVGQVVATQSTGNMGRNQKQNVTFNTANLANGVYFLTVEANGARKVSKVMIAH